MTTAISLLKEAVSAEGHSYNCASESAMRHVRTVGPISRRRSETLADFAVRRKRHNDELFSTVPACNCWLARAKQFLEGK